MVEDKNKPVPSRDLESTEMPLPRSEDVPDRIGDYRILQKLGEGGMGEVYLAQQEKPVRRRVALKLIKVGMDTKQVVARFEAERQALALMNHPNIARVFDAGATDKGRPFFAMEYVKGEPITAGGLECQLSLDHDYSISCGARYRLSIFSRILIVSINSKK